MRKYSSAWTWLTSPRVRAKLARIDKHNFFIFSPISSLKMAPSIVSKNGEIFNTSKPLPIKNDIFSKMIEKVLKTCLAIRKGRDRKHCFLGSYLSQCDSLGHTKSVSKLIRFEIFILKILI